MKKKKKNTAMRIIFIALRTFQSYYFVHLGIFRKKNFSIIQFF